MDGQADRIRAVVEEVLGCLESILAHGEVERRPVSMKTADQARVLRQQPANGRQVSGDAGAEEFPEVSAGAGGPFERFALLELLGLDHVRLAPCDTSKSA